MRRDTLVLWFSRVVLTLVTGILLLISVKNLFDPVGATAARGIVLSNGTGRTIARVGFGGFPLASAIVIVTCAIVADRVRLGLWYALTLFGTVLGVRLVAAAADGSLADNIRLVVPEVAFLVLTIAALVLGRRRKAVLQ